MSEDCPHVNVKAVQEHACQAKLSPQPEVPNLVEDTNGRPADMGIHEGHGFGDNVVASSVGSVRQVDGPSRSS